MRDVQPVLNAQPFDRPAHLSEIYYSVIVGNGQFAGWRCVFAGDGAFVFHHQDGREKRYYGGHGEGWMQRCWDDFTAMATQT